MDCGGWQSILPAGASPKAGVTCLLPGEAGAATAAAAVSTKAAAGSSKDKGGNHRKLQSYQCFGFLFV